MKKLVAGICAVLFGITAVNAQPVDNRVDLSYYVHQDRKFVRAKKHLHAHLAVKRQQREHFNQLIDRLSNETASVQIM